MGNILSCVDGPKASNVQLPSQTLPGAPAASSMSKQDVVVAAPKANGIALALFKEGGFVTTPYGSGKVKEVREAMIVISLAYGIGFIRSADCKPAADSVITAHEAAVKASTLASKPVCCASALYTSAYMHMN